MSRPVFLLLLSLLLVVVQHVSAASDSAPISSPYGPVYPLTLADPAIATDGPIVSLDDSTWSASAPSLNLEIAGNVPGDLITDLFLAGVIPEPLYEQNWLNASIWNDHIWYYNHSVSLSAMQYAMLGNDSDGFDLLLTFDGIKMGADIYMNDVRVGQALAQFGRLIFSLKSLMHNKTLAGAVKQGENRLSVGLRPQNHHAALHAVHGRLGLVRAAKQSRAQHWPSDEPQRRLSFSHLCSCLRSSLSSAALLRAPFSNTTTPDGSMATFSKGIWKSVYIATVYSVAVTALTPLTTYNGPFPTAPLADGGHRGLHAEPDLPLLQRHQHPDPAVHHPELVHRDCVQRHGARGLPASRRSPCSCACRPLTSCCGGRRGWAISRCTTCMRGCRRRPAARAVQVSRRVGFKFFAIVTGNDTDPSYVQQYADADGTDTLGMRFRVNGAPIFARGANVIPMDTMEGRYTAAAHRRMVINAREGGMNILRIWGGGVILPSIFYATADDEQGLLVYHDMMNRDFFSPHAGRGGRVPLHHSQAVAARQHRHLGRLQRVQPPGTGTSAWESWASSALRTAPGPSGPRARLRAGPQASTACPLCLTASRSGRWRPASGPSSGCRRAAWVRSRVTVRTSTATAGLRSTATTTT